MMKHEFEAIAKRKVSDADYKEIEYVYTWHPLIPNSGGKQKIADIYNLGGMMLIKDMLETAKRAEGLENHKAYIRSQISKLEKEAEEAEEEFKQYLEGRRS